MSNSAKIKEFDDRWIINPLRRRDLVGFEFGADGTAVFLFESGFELRTGIGAELARGSVAEDAPGRHSLVHWSAAEARKILDASVTSPVFFKHGGLRIALSNGWKIFVSTKRSGVSAELLNNGAVVWTPAGLADDPCFPVVQIDRWTGREISAPPWPGRPAGLDFSNADDING